MFESVKLLLETVGEPPTVGVAALTLSTPDVNANADSAEAWPAESGAALDVSAGGGRPSEAIAPSAPPAQLADGGYTGAAVEEETAGATRGCVPTLVAQSEIVLS